MTNRTNTTAKTNTNAARPADKETTFVSRNGHGIATTAVRLTESAIRAMHSARNSMVCYGD